MLYEEVRLASFKMCRRFRSLMVSPTNSMYDHPSLFARVMFQDALRKAKILEELNAAQKQCFSISFGVFFFYCSNLAIWVFPSYLVLFSFSYFLTWCCVVRRLCKWSGSFDAPIHWRVRTISFYYWGDCANWPNRNIRTCEEWWMTVRVYTYCISFSHKYMAVTVLLDQ